MPLLLTELADAARLLNENQGVVSVALFACGLFLGWVTGIFEALRRKPKLKLGLIPGPTLCTTFFTGEKRDGRTVHRTAISIYLRIANIGTAATSIQNVALGYHWNIRSYNPKWLRYRISWSWIDHPHTTLDDFQAQVGGERIKIYPSLFQGSATTGKVVDTYLEPGRIISGVVYFEIGESWGGHFPAQRAGQTHLRVAVTDGFGIKHKKNFWVPVVTLDKAKTYNPSFGQSLSSLPGKLVDVNPDEPTD
jgi:hypothetical protein